MTLYGNNKDKMSWVGGRPTNIKLQNAKDIWY